MAWKHGPKPAEQLWLRRKEIEMETQLDAHRNGLKLIVIGGEGYRHKLVVHAILDRVHRRSGIKQLIVNDCPAVSDWAREWAKPERVDVTLVACDLERDGKNAEFCRNATMLKTRPDGMIAFPGGGSTELMLAQARRAGVKIWQPIKDDRR